MKQITRLFLFLGVIINFFSCKEENYKAKTNFNSNWYFTKVDAISDANFHQVDFNATSWESVRLPHTANIEPLLVNNQWQGICWYRKDFDIPVNPSSKKVLLELEGAMNFSQIWINGTLVSEHHGGYLPVKVDITNQLQKGKNTIAIRLDNTDNKTTGPKPLNRLDFNMYGGLYRNAWLYIKEKVHITDPILANKVAGGGVFITYPKVTKKLSEVAVKTNVANDENIAKTVTLKQSIYDGEVLVQEKSTTKKINAQNNIDVTTLFTMQNAKLWSTKHPNLYHLVTQIFVDDIEVDVQKTHFGIREFTFDNDNQLLINGEKTFLRGVNRHQEYPFVGYALSDNAQYRDAQKIKEAGFNYIRLSHYPQSNAFMDACDELGIIVIDAILGWQFYNNTDAFRNYCYTSATELVRRDRNRPAVLAWEVSLNETKMPIFFMEKLHDIVHQEYPGDNVYSCGWMDDVYDIYLQARQHRILHPHELKDIPYSVSEYGDWEYFSKNAGLNQDNLPNELRDEMSSRQARSFGETRLLQQAYNIQEAHNDNLNTVAYSDSYWVMYDYNRGYGNNLEHSGIMDIFRIPKFGYYFYQSQRNADEGEVLKIASYWNEKSPLDVTVYSNADEVALFLNDELIGKQKPNEDNNTNKLNHPPFTFIIPKFKKGTLKAIGYRDGKQVSNNTVTTPQKPVKFNIWIDESGKKPEANVNDVVFCYIEAVDENGTINPDFSEVIDVKTEGDIEILNVDTIKAEAGIATVLIRLHNSDDIIISAKTKDISGFVTLKVK